MQNFIRNLMMMSMLRDEKKEADAGGGSGYESKEPPTQPPADNKGSQEKGDSDDEFDEFGYKKVPEKKPEGDKKSEAKADDKSKQATDTKVENSSTGYGDEPPKDDAAAAPKDDKKDEKQDVDLGFELKTGDLSKEEVAKLKKFVKENNVSQDIAQKYADQRQQEFREAQAAQAKAEEEYKAAVVKQKRDWHNELKNDPEFGGEKFGFHVKQVDKVLENFMPNTKKVLTERGSMLPPYVMRDLAKMAERLYATENLQTGQEPKREEAQDDESNDPLSFYT